MDVRGRFDARIVVISLADSETNDKVVDRLLRLLGVRGIVAGMSLSSACPGEGTDARPPSPPDQVAGRIDAAPTPLQRDVNAWLAHLLAKGRRARSCTAFRQTIERAIRDRGWTTPEDLTADAVLGWLDEMRAGGAWTAAATYNRALTAFKSLCRHLARTGKIPRNPLADESPAVSDDAGGSRAARTDEARAIVAHAWMRQRTDGRARRSSRALYWLCEFAHGCRSGEPELWQWKRHMFLDAEVPHVRWTSDINKNRREQIRALAPELAEQLRSHREAMRELAKTTPVVVRINRRTGARSLRQVDPDHPDAFVFPVTPPRGSFKSDQANAGVAYLDEYGQPFTPHSARKWFSTTLTEVGVPEKMADFLMRHAGRVEHRYYKPGLPEQAAALARLPRLWPEQGHSRVGAFVDNKGTTTAPAAPAGVNLTSAAVRPDDGPRLPDDHLPERQLGQVPRPRPTPSGRHSTGTERPGDLPEFSPEQPPADPRVVGPDFNPPLVMQKWAVSHEYRVDRTWLADTLELTARLLREGAARAPDPQPEPGPDR
jgi:hypothetical protein